MTNKENLKELRKLLHRESHLIKMLRLNGEYLDRILEKMGAERENNLNKKVVREQTAISI